MDREVVEHIKKTRRKEKQNKHAKKATTTMIIAKQVVERELTRKQQVIFITTWSFAMIKGVKNKFHPNFKEEM
jgi:acid phosphatase class B